MPVSLAAKFQAAFVSRPCSHHLLLPPLHRQLSDLFTKMTSLCTPWSLKEFLFNHYDKSAQITVACKGKCFCIQTSPENFEQSPESLETYVRLMDATCDDKDMEDALIAKEDLL
jgi:hypothetical protein